jgi:hypothetical protein
MRKISRVLVIIFILLSTACKSIEIGFETTPTTTEKLPTQQVIIPTIAMTSTPAKTITTPTEESVKFYTQPDYGFSFQYPASWIIQTEKNQILLTGNTAELVIGFSDTEENISNNIDLPSNAALQDYGSLNFLTQTISRNAWIVDQKLQAIFYNSGTEIKVGSMIFTFLLRSTTDNPPASISRDVQSQADRILTSFEATFELTTSVCTDTATFIQDVTVLDDTRFSPGERFIKTWQLSNSGTCIWASNYALVFIDGDQMTGDSPVPIPNEVLPGQIIDLSIELIAPASTGTYRGNWMLQNDKGEEFGLGLDGDKPFWVQITVGETTPDILESLGDPDFRDSLVTTNNWYLLETANTKFSGNGSELLLTSISPGPNDEWGMANISPLKDFYLEVIFKTQSQCSGLDRYGVIVRAPDPNQGYVFGFSCDGRYRLFIWDGSRYQAIQEWKSSPLIKDGPNQTNRLGIYLDGDQIKLYANGKLLSEYTDTTFAEGRFGVFIGADQTQNFTVALEEVIFWKIND